MQHDALVLDDVLRDEVVLAHDQRALRQHADLLMLQVPVVDPDSKNNKSINEG